MTNATAPLRWGAGAVQRHLGRARATPIGKLGMEFLAKYRENDLGGLAAELSYRIFLSLFPFLIVLAALSGFMASVAGVSDPGDRLVRMFGDSLPADAASILSRQAAAVADGSHTSALSFGTVAALWAASAAAGTMIKSMNRAYGLPESRALWQKAALSLAMTLSAGFALLVATVAVFVTQLYAREIAAWAGLGRGYDLVVQLLRLPVILVAAMTATAVIYWIAPDHGGRFRMISPGVVLFGSIWTAGTAGFALYVSTFGSYGATYGALSGAVVLLVWIYLSCLALLAGAQINALLDERTRGQALAARRAAVPRRR